MNKDINDRVAILELANYKMEGMIFCSHDSCGYEKKFVSASPAIYPKVTSYVRIDIERYLVKDGMINPFKEMAYLTKAESEQLIKQIRSAIKEIENNGKKEY